IGREHEEAFDRLAVRIDLADLRADVRVEAVQLELWPREDRAHSRLGRAARDVEAELRVLGSGQQVRVRMGVDAGPDAQEDRRARVAFRGDASEERDLVEVVDDDAADAFRAPPQQLVLARVGAVEEDAMALITSPISAARRRPTTPAFTPASADCAHGRARSAPHDGSAAKTTRNAGRKIATSAIAAPATPFGGQTAKRSTIALGSLYEGNG